MNDKKNPILKDHIDLNPFLARDAMSSQSEKKGMKKVAKKLGMSKKLDNLLSGKGCNALTKDQCDKSFFCDYNNEEKVCEKSEELEEFIELNELQRRLNKSVLDAYVLISRRVIERECTPDPNVSKEYQKWPYLCRPYESFETFKNKQEDKSLYDDDYLDYDIRDLLEVVDYVVPDEGLPHNLGYLHDKQTLLEEFKIDGECIILGKKDKELLLSFSKQFSIGGMEGGASVIDELFDAKSMIEDVGNMEVEELREMERYRRMNYFKLKEQILLDIKNSNVSDEEKQELLFNFKICSDEKIRGKIVRFLKPGDDEEEFTTREQIEKRILKSEKEPSKKQLILVEIEINKKKYQIVCLSSDLRILGKLPSHLETIPKPIRILIAATLALTYNKNKDRDIKIGHGVNLMKKVLVPLSGGLFELFNEMGEDVAGELEEGIEEAAEAGAQLFEEGEQMTSHEFQGLADKHLSSVALGIQQNWGWNPDPLLKQGRPSSLGIITSSQLKSSDPNNYGSSLDFFMNRLCLGLKELMNMINSCNSLHELRELLKSDFFVQLDNEPLYTEEKLKLLPLEDLRELYYQLNERGFCKFYKDDYQLLKEHLFKIADGKDNLKEILRNILDYQFAQSVDREALQRYVQVKVQLDNYVYDGDPVGNGRTPYEVLCLIINMAFNRLYTSELLGDEDALKLFSEIDFILDSEDDSNVSVNLETRTDKNNYLAGILLLQDNVLSENTECKRLKEINQRLFASIDAVVVGNPDRKAWHWDDLQLSDFRNFFVFQSNETLKKLIIYEIVNCQLISDSFEEQTKINKVIHGNVMRMGGEDGSFKSWASQELLKMWAFDAYYRGNETSTVKDKLTAKVKDKVKDKLKMHDFDFDSSEDITQIFEELLTKIDKKNPQMPITDRQSQGAVTDVENPEPTNLSGKVKKMIKPADDVP